jgi:PAS domain S-box-containing protein
MPIPLDMRSIHHDPLQDDDALIARIPAIPYVEAPTGARRLGPQAEVVFEAAPDAFKDDADLWRSIVHPDDRGAIAPDPDPARRTATYRVRVADGTYRWFRDDAAFAPDIDGGSWIGTLTDVTEERTSEDALRDAVTKFRALVEQMPAVVYLHGPGADPANIPEFMSRRYEEIFGHPIEERMADPELWSKILHPDDRDRALEIARHAAATGEPFSMDYRIVRKDGEVAWIHDETVLVRDDRGDPLFWQGVATDITERKHTEGALRDAAAKFQTLAEQIPAVTYIEQLGETASPIYMSPQYEAILGFTPQERLATPGLWESRLHPDDRDRVLAEVAAMSDDVGGWSLEYRMLHRDGHPVWLRDEAVLVRDDDGTPLFHQGVLFDISESKHAEHELERALDELRRADEIKDAFLTAVSHDLRTPLSTILGNAITLEHGDELGLSGEDRAELLHALASKARRLTDLITDLLDMDRLSRGAIEPRFAPDEVGSLVTRLVRDTDALGGRRVELDVWPVVAVVDRAMVERIVENLLVNAAKHTPADATVWVRVRPLDTGVELIVEDDGPGVPEPIRETLFRPFERGPSASPHAPGVGLGLSLVARFAELHGGRAWVEERSGGGASFHVVLASGNEGQR